MNKTGIERLTDAQRHCLFDLYAGVLHGSLSIADVDADGVGESTFNYRLSCRSDVSPGRLTLVMHEAATKYAIRGTTKLANGCSGGKITVDPVLDNAAPALKAFSIEKWNRYVAEDHFKQI